ncbi:MAG: ribulose-phosphate 3-epimerase [Lactobacillaceae bacterium]|jgi:ribulose-phosphate 3-epimerase|nr:ribulose-phosphate 3-epimerase [Lactobacillaceae bacterium]
MVKIAPSILSADFGILREEVIALENSGADLVHFDVMDGSFVPNLTFGPHVLKSIRPYLNIPIDVHLMVKNPVEMIPWFANAGADIITIHAEAVTHLDSALDMIRQHGKIAGVSLNPSTPENVLEYVLDKVDLILVMTVNPGFGGQEFISSQLEKISKIKEMIRGYDIEIEVDGGINPMTAQECAAAGADILVAGTSVFATDEYKQNIDALR